MKSKASKLKLHIEVAIPDLMRLVGASSRNAIFHREGQAVSCPVTAMLTFSNPANLGAIAKRSQKLVGEKEAIYDRLVRSVRSHELIAKGGGINERKDSLPAHAPQFTTQSILRRFVRAFCEGERGLNKEGIGSPFLTDDTYRVIKENLWKYLFELQRVLPLLTDQVKRKEHLFRSSAGLLALGVIGHLLYHQIDEPTQRRKMIDRLSQDKLDWRRKNITEWKTVMGVALHGEISPRSGWKWTQNTIKHLKKHMGLSDFLKSQALPYAQKGTVGNEVVQPLSPDAENALRDVLPEAIKEFSGKPDDFGVSDLRSYYDAWFQVPGLSEKYASLGFEFGGQPLYWAVPRPSEPLIPDYKKEGYKEDGKYLYKYLPLPSEFAQWGISDQKQWLKKRIGSLLQEDKRLRGL